MPKTYPVPIVGESLHQKACRATEIGDYVDIYIEEGNPHADGGEAIRVDNMDGDTIGYIAEDHWLRRAILKEGKQCLAKVLDKRGRTVGIVLEVQLEGEEVKRVQYGEKAQQESATGCMLATVIVPAVLVLSSLSACSTESTDAKPETLDEFYEQLENVVASKPSHTSRAYAIVKYGAAGRDWLITVHGYPDNLSVCEELIAPYNEGPELSAMAGGYRCEEVERQD